MTAFAAAAATVAADPNVGRDALYLLAGRYPAQAVRVSLASPDRVIDVGDGSFVTPDAVVMVPVATIGIVYTADVFLIGNVPYRVVQPRLDTRGTSWRAACIRMPDETPSDALLRGALPT